MVSMPAPNLPALEHHLEACLIELERLYEARPRMSDALGRAAIEAVEAAMRESLTP